MNGEVTSTVNEPVATLLLNRAEKRNAMTYAMWSALAEQCAALAGDERVRVVVLRGAGGHFCAGADITDLRAPRAAGTPTFLEVNHQAERALATLPKPTIAAIEGDCIGGGCAMAIDCDFRLAAPSARFGITPAKLGIVYPAVSLERAVAVIGAAAAKRLLMTGELIDATTALRIGLIDQICDDLDGAVTALAEELSQRSLLTQAATKEMIAAVALHGYVPEDLAEHWSAVAAAADDAAEGARAFAQRRRPVFTWRP